MKFWETHNQKIKNLSLKTTFFKQIQIEKFTTFQIFNNLCILRKWKKLKILKIPESQDFLVVGVFPASSNSNSGFEIFLPLYFNNSMIRMNFLLNSRLTIVFKKFSKNFYILNLAFIDRDGSITYYKISKGIKKTTGPFIY